jgi:sugar lactone lactonase YvrE
MSLIIGGTRYTSACATARGILLTAPDSGEVHLMEPKADNAVKCISKLDNSQVSGACYDTEGKNLYVADLAAAAVLLVVEPEESKEGKSREVEVEEFVKDYEGEGMIGPNNVCSGPDGSLFFTDSGPLGETTLQDPNGSCFCISQKYGEPVLVPLALNCLAHPSGIAMSPDGTSLYVAETFKNRILRFVQHPKGIWQLSVYHQFSGRLGPMGLACGNDGTVYVARFETRECAVDGVVSVIRADGSRGDDIVVPGPEVTGVAVSGSKLYVTEGSTKGVYGYDV